jgi:glycosyltransferase involved in cell wall biosynthesis
VIINYLTYQSFPADTANSLQTISNIKYFVKSGFDVSLYFPLREKQSDSNLKNIQNHYGISESFQVIGFKHLLPFGRIRVLKKSSFHLSHFLWSWFIVRRHFTSIRKQEIFFTRSEWVLYFLAKKGHQVLFECHQTSKIRNYILKKTKHMENIKYIFLNKHLEAFYQLPQKRSFILHNGVDSELFNIKKIPRKKEIVFVGNLSRFKKTRNIDFLIKCYKLHPELKKYKLSIVGGPNDVAEELKLEVRKNNLSNSIFIHGRQSRKISTEIINSSTIGVLINSKDNIHSYKYTSPLKYFEYLYGGLNVVAVKFPAHEVLPYSGNITFFNEGDTVSFLTAIKDSINKDPTKIDQLKNITLAARVEKIKKIIES